MKFLNKTKTNTVKKILGGGGAGVSVRLEGDIAYELKGEVVTFKPSKVNVQFESYMDQKEGKDGLEIKLDDITDKDEIEKFKDSVSGTNGDYSGSYSINFNDGVFDPAYPNSWRKIILSPGYVRAKYKKGDGFELQLLVGDLLVKGVAHFTEEGQQAWEDLDSSSEDDLD